MGFLGGLFKKSGGSDPLDALREKVEANPKDARLAQDLASQLHQKGDAVGAIEYARRAAQAHKEAGFNQKAASVLKLAVSWGTPTTELLSDLADLLLEMKHKEDARGMLIKLRQLHVTNGNKSELSSIDAKLAELGFGR